MTITFMIFHSTCGRYRSNNNAIGMSIGPLRMLRRACCVAGFLFISCLMCVVISCVPAHAANLCGPTPPTATELAAFPSMSLTVASIEATDSGGASARSVLRLSGATRYDTMSSIASVGVSEAPTVVIASGENFPDALAASALAGRLRSPVLLTSSSVLSSQAEYQITRLGVKRAIVLGGEAAVSESVVNRLRDMDLSVERIYGAARQETAEAIAHFVDSEGNSDTAIVASGYSPWDALSISPFAYNFHSPVFLTAGDGSLSDSSLATLKSLGSIHRVIVVGGPSAVSSEVESQLCGYEVERWSGQTRYETSLAIASESSKNGMSFTNVALASGVSFPDALSGGALVGERDGIVLLTSPDGLGLIQLFLSVNRGSISNCYVLGGCEALGRAVENQAKAALEVSEGDEASSMPDGRTILAFSPHQDDETLSMGFFVAQSVSNGCDVHETLCTDGSGSWVRSELANGTGCDFHDGIHSFDLPVSEFVKARDAEFVAGCEAIGVPSVNVAIDADRAVDGELTLSQARCLILKYLDMYPDAIVCTISPLVGSGQHADHRTLGQAALDLYREGYIKELRLFVEPYNISEFVKSNPDLSLFRSPAPSQDCLAELRAAIGCYSDWEPALGKYAIGYHSVGAYFDLIGDAKTTPVWHSAMGL